MTLSSEMSIARDLSDQKCISIDIWKYLLTPYPMVSGYTLSIGQFLTCPMSYDIHLRSIFAHIDAYVDRWRLQYEGGDAPKHVVELGLVLAPNEDLCRLLFTCLKSCCHGLEAIGLKTVDVTIRDGGCLNKISIDVETLERERRSREEFFCSLSSILSSKMRGGSNLDASEDECKKRKRGYLDLATWQRHE